MADPQDAVTGCPARFAATALNVILSCAPPPVDEDWVVLGLDIVELEVVVVVAIVGVDTVELVVLVVEVVEGIASAEDVEEVLELDA